MALCIRVREDVSAYAMALQAAGIIGNVYASARTCMPPRRYDGRFATYDFAIGLCNKLCNRF